jgi:D-alanyl-D-alanine carboxypeptidase
VKSRTLRTSMAATAALALLAAACGNDSNDAAVDEPPEDEAVEVDEEAEDVEPEVEVDEEALQAILDEWRTDVDTFGATLSVRVPGHGDIHLASGIDDRDPETPMSTDGTFGIRGITRSFVAAIALQLVEEGRLSLDDPVEPWLPELPDADQMTLAMLLDNTSGLGAWEETNDYRETLIDDPDRSFTPEEVLAKHLEQPQTGPPGGGYAFTDAGYIAVGLLIERELDQEMPASSRTGSPSRSRWTTRSSVTARPGQPGMAGSASMRSTPALMAVTPTVPTTYSTFRAKRRRPPTGQTAQ